MMSVEQLLAYRAECDAADAEMRAGLGLPPFGLYPLPYLLDGYGPHLWEVPEWWLSQPPEYFENLP